MSIFVAVVLASAPAVAPDPPVAEEVVVIGERLKVWRGKWRMRKGVAACTTTKSTGDREIDAIGCGALVACVNPLVPQMQAIANLKTPKGERNRRMNAAAQSIGPCVSARRADAIAELAARRAG